MNFLIMFATFIYYGFLCLSGGSSLMQFYIDDLVNGRHWMTLEELGNLVAISQVTPGPIGVNLATFIGYQQGGFWGGLVCTVGLLLPSFFLMSLAVHSYNKWQESRLVQSLMFGVKPMTVALVVAAILACLGMSIFTDEIPFAYISYWLLNSGKPYEGTFAVRYEMFPILLFSTLALHYKKLSIIAVIFLSALFGVLTYALLGMLN